MDAPTLWQYWWVYVRWSIVSTEYANGSTHKGLYRFGAPTVEVTAYFRGGVLALGVGYKMREFHLQPGALLSAYIECARMGIITGWY